MTPSTNIYIDTDNALGSPSGDVDDAFAIIALLSHIHTEASSRTSIVGIGSVFGNTSTQLAHANNTRLAKLAGYDGPIVCGAEAAGDGHSQAVEFLLEQNSSHHMAEETVRRTLRIAALGPLTNMAAAASQDPRWCAGVEELVIVGSNTATKGRWPPVWPHEFNLFKDRAATSSIFASSVPLTILPLNVATRMRIAPGDLNDLPQKWGQYFRRHCLRWQLRSVCLRLSRRFPVWDLPAAMYMVRPDLFEVIDAHGEAFANGLVTYGSGPKCRAVRVIADFDPDALWRAFAEATWTLPLDPELWDVHLRQA